MDGEGAAFDGVLFAQPQELLSESRQHRASGCADGADDVLTAEHQPALQYDEFRQPDLRALLSGG